MTRFRSQWAIPARSQQNAVALLDSALARPLNLVSYGHPEVFDVAASYAFGLAKNHPFIDGNKRIGFLAALVFLQINGWRCEANEADAAVRTLALAAGDASEKEYAHWLRENSRAL